MMNSETKADNLAKILWDYLQLHQNPVKSDIIFCLCSHDIRVAERASELMLAGYGKYLIFSGGSGRLTKGLFNKSEADIFAEAALKAGIEKEKIIIENKSTNTGENILFTYSLLQELDLSYNSVLLVQKPYMERRTLATFERQWPGNKVALSVSSPELDYDRYMVGDIDKKEVINVMVGDMQRIKEYPKLGFQTEQIIPNRVWKAFNELIDIGYNKHLITK
jgi:uncharacterized SAM-binding protein YcdF (DUF218 family)